MALALRATRSCLLTVDGLRGGFRILACGGTEAVLGIPARDFESDPGRWLELVADGDRERVRVRLDAAGAGRPVAPFEVRMVLADGGIRRLRIDIQPPIPPGASTGTCDLLLTDVTREHEARNSRRRTIRRLCRLATLDALTGLCNRRGLRDALRRTWSLARRRGADTGIVMLDIDGFKAINDESGHAAGDDVLREAAERVRGALRAEDVVCRYGGDEIVVLLPLADPAGTRAVAARLLQAFRSQDFAVGGRRRAIRVSIGAACGSSRDYAGPESLLREADRALGRAKREGRDRLCIGGMLPPDGPGARDGRDDVPRGAQAHAAAGVAGRGM